MHFCCAIFTKEFPTDTVIDNVLAPLYEGNYSSEDGEMLVGEPPAFMWDWFQMGGRFAGHLKLKIDQEDPRYNWRYYAREPRAGRLFRSYLLEKAREKFFSEEECYSSMGANDGFLYCDGGLARDMIDLDKLGTFCYISVNGESHAREIWDGEEFHEDPDYAPDLEAEVQRAIANDHYICIIDIHD